MSLLHNVLYQIMLRRPRKRRLCVQCDLKQVQHAGERFCRYCGKARIPDALPDEDQATSES